MVAKQLEINYVKTLIKVHSNLVSEGLVHFSDKKIRQ